MPACDNIRNSCINFRFQMAVLRRQVIKCNFLHRLFLLKAVFALMVFFSAFGAYQKIVQRRSALTNPAMLPRRVPHHHRMVRHIFGYNAARRNKSIFPNPMPADNGRIRPNARSFPYRGVGIVLRATLRIFASWPLDVGKHHGRAAKDIVSQLYALIQRNIILDFAVVTYSDMVSHKYILPNGTAGADYRLGADMAKMPYFRCV